MGAVNWLRKRLNQPVKFNIDNAIENAQAAAHEDLARLNDPVVAAVVGRWEGYSDPITDGIECDQDKRGPAR